MELSFSEQKALVSACGQLPTTEALDEERHICQSPVLILMSTVLSLNRNWYKHAIPARQRFVSNLYTKVSPPSLSNFSSLLTEISHSRTDWVSAATAMWSTKEARKAQALAELTDYLIDWFNNHCPGLADRAALDQWAHHVSKSEFVGQIKHLGPRAHEQLLWYIEGTQSIKLDRHIVQFVEDSVGRRPLDQEMIDAIKAAAGSLGLSPTELDARIWDYMQRRSSETTETCDRK